MRIATTDPFSSSRDDFTTGGPIRDLEIHPAWNRVTGYARMREVLESGPPSFAGVLAHTDHVAAGARQALRDAGLRVPEEISIVGFNQRLLRR